MINFAIVGCGGMGNYHADQLKKIPEVKVVALVDVLPDRTETYQKKYFPEAKRFASFDELLTDKSLDLHAVVLVTPHALHYPHAKVALEHGLHVLSEKPMVTSSKHAYDLWKTVKRTGKLFGIGFQAPYTAEFAYIAQARDRGDFGKIHIISGWMSQNWIRNTANTWRQDPEISGGGQMYDSGSHLLNAITWIMNEPVVEVSCFYDRVGKPVDINGVAIAKFQGGTLCSIAIGGACPPFASEIQIQADTMRIITDQYGGKLELAGRDSKRIYPHVVQNLEPVGAFGTPHQNFVDALLGRDKLRAPIRYGVLLSVLMDALYESGNTGKTVRPEPVPADI